VSGRLRCGPGVSISDAVTRNFAKVRGKAGPKLTSLWRTRFAAGLLAAVLAEADPAAGQSWAAVVSTETVCRAEPSLSADAVGRFEIGKVVLVNRRASAVPGQWMHVAPSRSGGYGIPGGCWVPSSRVARTTDIGHFVQLVEGLLSASVRPALDELLAVHNLLESSAWYRDRLEASAVLTERRTALLAMAVEVAQDPDPWSEAYLNLYERHRPDPFAEDILWEYASESVRRDCEGVFVCDVEESVINRLARYWIDFPNGRHLAEAVEQGLTVLGYGLESCEAARGPEPDSWEGRMWQWSGWEKGGEEITRELLATLEAVSEEDKAPLLEMLGELERCAEAG